MTHNFRYRFTCERCKTITDWIVAQIVQGSSSVRIDRNRNTRFEQPSKYLAAKIEALQTVIAQNGTPPAIQDEPFLVDVYNEIFAAGETCPHCGAKQSWYPAKLKWGKKDQREWDACPIHNKPEVDWRLPENSAKQEVENYPPTEPESVEIVDTVPLSEKLDISKSDYADIMLQICDRLIELAVEERFVRKFDLSEIKITSDNELFFSETYTPGTKISDSIHAIVLVIRNTPHRRAYKKIIKREHQYETLKEIKKDIENATKSVIGRNSVIIVIILFALFMFRRLFGSLLKPLVEIIQGFWGG